MNFYPIGTEDHDDGAEYGDSDREGGDDEVADDESDEGIGSGEEQDEMNLTLDNIDEMFENVDEEKDELTAKQNQERKGRIRKILDLQTGWKF